MTRDDFKQLYHLDKELKVYEEEIEKLEARGTGCTQHLSHAPGGGGGGKSKVEEAAVEMADFRNEEEPAIKKVREKRKKIYDELINHIDSVEDSEMRLILLLRYVRGKSFLQIANKLNKSQEAVKQKDYRFFKNLEKK